MLAMQYSIELPVGYDTQLIRSRVENRAKLFQGLAGLVHKSYLFNDTDKIYAPFYIWSDVGEASRFLFDDLFRGVIESFRRPRVRTWMVINSVYGNRDFEPKFAIRETDRIAPEDDLEARCHQEIEKQAELAKNPDLHFDAVALDAERWELVRYSLWRDEAHAIKPASDCIQTYEVLHHQGLAPI